MRDIKFEFFRTIHLDSKFSGTENDRSERKAKVRALLNEGAQVDNLHAYDVILKHALLIVLTNFYPLYSGKRSEAAVDPDMFEFYPDFVTQEALDALLTKEFIELFCYESDHSNHREAMEKIYNIAKGKGLRCSVEHVFDIKNVYREQDTFHSELFNKFRELNVNKWSLSKYIMLAGGFLGVSGICCYGPLAAVSKNFSELAASTVTSNPYLSEALDFCAGNFKAITITIAACYAFYSLFSTKEERGEANLAAAVR